jgi:hypothetical protein
VGTEGARRATGAEACRGSGEIGALLRREGLRARKRGPKAKAVDPHVKKLEQECWVSRGRPCTGAAGRRELRSQSLRRQSILGPLIPLNARLSSTCCTPNASVISPRPRSTPRCSRSRPVLGGPRRGGGKRDRCAEKEARHCLWLLPRSRGSLSDRRDSQHYSNGQRYRRGHRFSRPDPPGSVEFYNATGRVYGVLVLVLEATWFLLRRQRADPTRRRSRPTTRYSGRRLASRERRR